MLWVGGLAARRRGSLIVSGKESGFNPAYTYKSAPVPRLLHVQGISHAMVLVSCPGAGCNRQFMANVDNITPETVKCRNCGMRFTPKVRSIEVSYREVAQG